jgi:predicted  nucleic acid-binding Zn ribbon protein
MLAVELTVDSIKSRASFARTHRVTSLISALVRNGNLVEAFPVAAGSGAWTVHGIAPARDAFQKANWNEYVQRAISGLAQVDLKLPRIRFLGPVPETGSAFRCGKPKGYFLFTTFLQMGPPVHCIDCGGPIPLYRLPRSKTSEHSALLCWNSNYKACDTLQMKCTVGERFGERQMSDINSALSRSGLAVCEEIEQSTGRPTYYYLYRGTVTSAAKELRRKCPGCGSPWLMESPLHHKFDFKCDKCHLLSNFAWKVRSSVLLARDRRRLHDQRGAESKYGD